MILCSYLFHFEIVYYVVYGSNISLSHSAKVTNTKVKLHSPSFKQTQHDQSNLPVFTPTTNTIYFMHSSTQRLSAHSALLLSFKPLTKTLNVVVMAAVWLKSLPGEEADHTILLNGLDIRISPGILFLEYTQRSNYLFNIVLILLFVSNFNVLVHYRWTSFTQTNNN